MVSINLVKNKKNLIVLLAILFSSAIFSTSSSIIYSIDNFNEYLYGDENDIIVIYDNTAETPFTSDVPASYDAILNQIEGVLLTSPELIIPGVYNDYSLLMRSANFTALKTIENLKIIQGDEINDNDKASVVVGISLAERLGISVGQDVYFRGSLKNNAVLLRVEGIFTGPPELEDEMISSLDVGHKLSVNEDVFNHIKVKFDPDITSANTILDIVTSLYDNLITLRKNNNTEIVELYDLQIIDFEGDVIFNETINEEVEISLPFGEFEFIFSQNRSVLLSEVRFIQMEGNQTFSIQDFEYETNFSITSDISNNLIAFEIFNQTNYRIANGFISNEDNLSLILRQGQYTFVFSTPERRFEFERIVSEISNFSFPLSGLTLKPGIFGINNGTYIYENLGKFYLNNIITSESYIVLLNGNLMDISNNYFNFNLAEGSHNIEIKDEDDTRLTYLEFYVTPSLEPNFELNEISNFAHLSQGDEIVINSSIPEESIISITGNNEEISFVYSNSKIFFNASSNLGMYNISVNYVDYRFNQKNFNIILFVEENPKQSGIVQSTNEFHSDALLQMWYSSEILDINIDGDSLPMNSENRIRLPNLAVGLYNIIVNFAELQESISIEVVELNSLFEFTDTGGEISDLNSTILTDDVLSVKFSEFTYNVYFNYSGELLKVPSSQFLPVITSNDLTEIIIENEITKETIEFQIELNAGITNSIPDFDTMANINVQGLIADYYLDKISIIETYITGLNLNDNIISRNGKNYLIPGLYEISFDLGGSNFLSQIEVPIWSKSVQTQLNLTSKYGNITENNGLLPDSILLNLNGQYIYYESYNPFEITGATVNNNFNVDLSNLVIEVSTLNNGGTNHFSESFSITTVANSTFSLSYNFTNRYNQHVTGSGQIRNIGNSLSNRVILHNPDDLNIVSLELYNDNVDYYELLSTDLNDLNQIENRPNIEMILRLTTTTKVYNLPISHLGDDIYLDLSTTRNVNIYNPNFNYTFTIYDKVSLKRNGVELNYVMTDIWDTSLEFYSSFDLDIFGYKKANLMSNITFISPIEYSSALLTVKNGIGIEAGNVRIVHNLLGTEQSLVRSNNNWLIQNFPLGPINISITRFTENVLVQEYFIYQDQEIIIVFDPLNEVSLDKFLTLGIEISADLATEFFNTEITGPFAFFRISLIAESVIIIFLLIINVSGVYAGIVSEHRHELKTLKSMGFTNHQLVMSIIRGSLKFSIPILFLGGLMGIGLANLLLITENTILFGHTFVPRFPRSYWILNLIVGHALMYIGAFVGLKLEGETIKS